MKCGGRAIMLVTVLLMLNAFRKLQRDTRTMRYAALLPAVVVLCFLAEPSWAQKVMPPAEHLGHPVGADFKMPGWKVVSDYYRHLAATSPCVKLESVGK